MTGGVRGEEGIGMGRLGKQISLVASNRQFSYSWKPKNWGLRGSGKRLYIRGKGPAGKKNVSKGNCLFSRPGAKEESKYERTEGSLEKNGSGGRRPGGGKGGSVVETAVG